MSDYGVTDKGFQMRRLDEIYADICKRFKDEVGVDPSENPQSVMNVLFTILRMPRRNSGRLMLLHISSFSLIQPAVLR